MIADFHIFYRHTLQKIATGDMQLTCLSKFVYRHYVEKLDHNFSHIHCYINT